MVPGTARHIATTTDGAHAATCEVARGRGSGARSFRRSPGTARQAGRMPRHSDAPKPGCSPRGQGQAVLLLGGRSLRRVLLPASELPLPTACHLQRHVPKIGREEKQEHTRTSL